MSNAGYTMLSWVQRGVSALAAGLDPEDPQRLSVPVGVNVTARPKGGSADENVPVDHLPSIRLYGPGDVLGFAPSAVARQEPKANIGDFEPNYFPFVEFTEPDFPWRFSTKNVDTDDHQRRFWPWVTLLVLERDQLFYTVQSDDTWTTIANRLYGSSTVASALQSAVGDPGLSSGVLLSGLPRTLTDADNAAWNIRTDNTTDEGEYTVNPSHDNGTAGQNLPPSISVQTSVLPDLNEAWRWAHVQVSNPKYSVRAGDTWETIATAFYGSVDVAGALEAALDSPALLADELLSGFPAQLTDASGQAQNFSLSNLSDVIRDQRNSVVSRLLCARRLKPGRRYQAFIVPTYKVGVLAGLGQPLDGVSGDLLAWQTGDGSEIELPYYYTWEFGTGLRGDFEYLVRMLEPRELKGLGLRDVDCGSPGFGCTGVSRPLEDGTLSPVLSVEGALKSLDTSFTEWGHDLAGGNVPLTQTDLAEIVNQPGAGIAASSDDPPVVAPPIYGRWHAATSSVDPESSRWVDVLNLDPRHRAAAGLGAIVIEREQEPLMASAWKQIGPIEEANKLLRQAQLGREGSLEIHRRLDALPTGELLRVAQPVSARVQASEVQGEQPATVRERVRRSPIPTAAMSPAFRRVARRRGPLRRRQKKLRNTVYGDLLDRLNRGEVAAAGPAPKPDGMPSLCDLTTKMLVCDGMFKWANLCCGRSASDGERQKLIKQFHLFCEENIDCQQLLKMLISESEKATTDEQRKRLKSIALSVEIFCGILSYLARLPKDGAARRPVDLTALRKAVLETVDPRKAIVERVWSRIRVSDGVARHRDPLNPIMAAPEFPQPMYAPLSKLSQDHILPGLASVAQNTIGLLEPNRRFIESYMAACSHAFASELLWRAYPTDQRGTYFRQFWDVTGNVPSVAEVNEVRAQLITEGHEPVDVDNDVRKRLIERRKDIPPIHLWTSPLGDNNARAPENNADNLVLLIRGDLLKKYPNTVIYAAPARYVTWGTGANAKRRRVPELAEYNELFDKLSEGLPEGQRLPSAAEGLRSDPIFGAKLDPDVTALGFALTKDQVKSAGDYAGYYFVIEQRASEARFGMDEADGDPVEIDDSDGAWNNLSWAHFFRDAASLGNGYVDGRLPAPATSQRQSDWSGAGSATIADITLQRPVRIAVHADRMLPG